MKKNVLRASIFFVVLILMVVFFHHPVVDSKLDFLPIIRNIDANGCNIIETKEMAFKIAKEIWIEKYGYFSIMFMIFDCRLENNEYWILEGSNYFHRLLKICGGGPYIVIEKNGRVVAVGYTGWIGNFPLQAHPHI